MNQEFNVNFESLIFNKLTFEEYFILWCLHYKNDTLLLKYVQNCRQIPTEIFNKLENKHFILINRDLDSLEITFNSLKITNSGIDLFKIQSFDTQFKELRESYPMEVGNTRLKRRLHSDLKRCRTLYKKILDDNPSLHSLICKCARLYHEEKKRSNSEMYMQSFVTWLHQQNYEQYMQDAINENVETDDNNYEVI